MASPKQALGRDIFAFGKDTEGLAGCFGAAVGKTIFGAEAAAAGFAAGASGKTVFAAGASGSTGFTAGASGSTGFTSGFEVGCVLFVSSDILFEGINSCTLRYIA